MEIRVLIVDSFPTELQRIKEMLASVKKDDETVLNILDPGIIDIEQAIREEFNRETVDKAWKELLLEESKAPLDKDTFELKRSRRNSWKGRDYFHGN